MDKVRIDKWLWAARFYKTRNLAKQAIDGGKVHCEGQRVKASKDLSVGLHLTIQQGWDKIEVRVAALSDQRGGAPQAQLLYEETQNSIAQREQAQTQRKAGGMMHILHEHKPNKKQRRQIHRFKRRDSGSSE